MTQLLQNNTSIANGYSMSGSLWFYLPDDVGPLSFINQALWQAGAVPPGDYPDLTGDSELRLFWQPPNVPVNEPDGVTEIHFTRFGPAAEIWGAPDLGIGSPELDIVISNRDYTVPFGYGDALWTSASWNHLAFAVEWVNSDTYGFTQVPGAVPYTINNRFLFKLNNFGIGPAFQDYDHTLLGQTYPLHSLGSNPSWTYANNDLYGGPPVALVTERTYPMDINTRQIAFPFNDNNPPSPPSTNDQRLVFNYCQIWFGQYIDWSVAGNFAKVAQVVGGALAPASDTLAAQKAFGASDIFFVRDSVSGIKYEDNQGTAGDFTVIGTPPQDFSPAPGQQT